ncbi:MAG: endonuclease/exonuclease/phosphatase family protein [Candidatus Thiodiazotropha taylori]|nr:endonuclease/exonuclease/phosphatase family protein [Candidatus Thiodiazotropha taylori]
MYSKPKSDGLGGFCGVSATLRLGMVKRFSYKRFHYFLLLMFLMMMKSNVHTTDIGMLSFILALQRSNETYKNISRPYSRIRSSLNRNIMFSFKCFKVLTVLVLTMWLLNLLLLCGDIHVNPGPDSVNDDTTSSSTNSITSFEMLSSHLSIFHLNIQSILPKIDLIRCEADAYDILVFSESWLKPEITDGQINIENFKPPFRNDRSGRIGGGVAIFVRDTITCKRRLDLEIRGLEAVWIEILINSKKVLLGGFYRPPNSGTDYFDLLTESIDNAYNSNIIDIIIVGDFNYNMASDSNKMSDLISQYNLKQLIKEPTHFTEHSSSIIDLILVRNNNNILTSAVTDPFIPDQTRYHCPIIVLLKFLRPKVIAFKRRVWNYKRADFDNFRYLLSQSDLETRLASINNIDESVKYITETIHEAASRSIPNNVVIIKQSDHPWVTCQIKQLIRKRKRYHKKFKNTSNLQYWAIYKKFRNKVVDELRKSKRNYFDKIESLMMEENINNKQFWKTSIFNDGRKH